MHEIALILDRKVNGEPGNLLFEYLVKIFFLFFFFFVVLLEGIEIHFNEEFSLK